MSRGHLVVVTQLYKFVISFGSSIKSNGKLTAIDLVFWLASSMVWRSPMEKKFRGLEPNLLWVLWGIAYIMTSENYVGKPERLCNLNRLRIKALRLWDLR